MPLNVQRASFKERHLFQHDPEHKFLLISQVLLRVLLRPTFSSAVILWGGGARLRGWGAALCTGEAAGGSDKTLGSCFTKMAVRSWLKDHIPSDSVKEMFHQYLELFRSSNI